MTTQLVQPITDDQLAEIEEYVTQYADDTIPPQISYEELIALITRLRAAEQDARRYRWLRDGNSSRFLSFYACGFPHHELDEAIDAAMSTPTPPE